MGMKYYEWLRGNNGCNCNNVCSDINPCSCDSLLLEISNLHTDDQVLQNEIDYVSGVVETISGGCDLDDYYTKEEIDAAIDTLENEIPSLSGYATEEWVENKNYLTEHQPLKTINGESISGTGDIVIEGSGTSVTIDDHLDSASTNPVENKVIVGALNGKLDASAYTPTDLSNYYTKEEVNSAITAVENEIPTVPTSNSAFTNDMHYVTSAETANYVTSGNVETQIVNHFWCGTQGEYEQLPTKQNNVLYLIHQ